jgi:hypothetical protein
VALLSALFARTARWVLPFAGLLVPGHTLAAQAVRASEYQVKAVFLFNFAQFVDWPATALADSVASLSICVLGPDPFGDFLDQTVRGERVGGRPLQVRRYRRADEIRTCHILFISRSEGSPPEDILAGLKHRPILTVSDIDGFAERGGMIAFVTDRNRIRLKINLDAAAMAHLTISSKLLRVAEVVTATGR